MTLMTRRDVLRRGAAAFLAAAPAAVLSGCSEEHGVCTAYTRCITAEDLAEDFQADVDAFWDAFKAPDFASLDDAAGWGWVPGDVQPEGSFSQAALFNDPSRTTPSDVVLRRGVRAHRAADRGRPG